MCRKQLEALFSKKCRPVAVYIYIDSLLKMYKAINRAFTIFNVKELFLNIAGMLKRNLKNEITQAFEKRERKELECSTKE